LLDGIETSVLPAAFALRMRVSMSAMGSVTFMCSFSPSFEMNLSTWFVLADSQSA
jgi:hypothetical protein